jgi:hypothetical protein
MLKKNTLFRRTVPLTVKQKPIQSKSKALECQSAAYFNLFFESLTASTEQQAILQRTATTAQVLYRGAKIIS